MYTIVYLYICIYNVVQYRICVYIYTHIYIVYSTICTMHVYILYICVCVHIHTIVYIHTYIFKYLSNCHIQDSQYNEAIWWTSLRHSMFPTGKITKLEKFCTSTPYIAVNGPIAGASWALCCSRWTGNSLCGTARQVSVMSQWSAPCCESATRRR